ncbi:putative uncharacterized protein DDB_G0289963 [Condylostylus longicornis]|uniref:putative uncharacterized protein DDB_G0289963 n=1 Tax=Condylostylus longicornis TaxID=2530218 RepID=UPI00244E34D6|nr:putative uncharacterized protein DDB_G0289963 [Condylostylus longicornis]
MSLVAYDASSDEEDNSDLDEKPETKIELSKSVEISDRISNSEQHTNGNISDEDEIYNDNDTEKTISSLNPENRKINLPLPKISNGELSKIDSGNSNLSIHMKLPTPKTLSTKINAEIIEEDDEFLHKKVEKPLIEKPPPPKKPPVKITIPSLSQFMEFKVENKKYNTNSGTKNSLNLLDMLPQPKNEEIFQARNLEKNKKPTSTVTSLIPDHVKNRMQQSKINSTTTSKKGTKTSKSLVNISDSDESDEGENQDFFSLNLETKLPEVSEFELNAMVGKKIAEIKKTSKKIDEMVKSTENNVPSEIIEEPVDSGSVDKVALQALVGASHAKRRKLVEEIQVVEISGEQILPSRDEWMRAALAAETTYQPKGVLVDEEPAPGTRKKHQITYLAHQAKANEAELQAMWAANRQNRRATASKYGF